MTSYRAAPIITDNVLLTGDQLQLINDLTDNAHEIWAAKRMADGWVWGESRDDKRKHHPCLVPYADLPESEKAYDREIVEQTIKAAIAIGYDIRKATS